MGLGKTLSELDAMTHEEFVGWRAFYHFEPWGCHPADQRAEYQLQMFHQAHSRPGSETPRFLERDPKPKPPQTQEQLEDDIRSFFAGRVTIKKVRRRKKKTEQPAPITNQKGGEHG